ncbi:ribokinase [Tropicimonas sp. IMCC6043]|uniref:ribokinase n=1 Tax=Tropicimonas sp. IMCC6043 TaxID=2510645 RepID=UPI00101CCFAF|nr:ribokinase [Tropicimonas sp. IMCC6043]RYH08021.1 ribokinase [Tropicimonas sp. IMCC6043]
MKAFVIGNVALDETLSIEDFPRPGASIFGAALSHDLGGKGANQAIAMSRTGLDCRFAGAVGRDARGEEIARRLAVEGLPARLIEIDGVATDLSIILMAERGENAVITTREAAAALTPDMVRDVLDDAEPWDLLVMQGNLGAETTRAALSRARDLEMRTAINPSPLQPYFGELWSLVDSAFVNEGEAEALGGIEALLAAGVENVVLTLGGQGAALIRTDGRVDVPAVPCAVIDTTGAGDCFMAVALASAALRGGALDARALEHAARAAAHTVARPGTVAAFPDRAEMTRILAA